MGHRWQEDQAKLIAKQRRNPPPPGVGTWKRSRPCRQTTSGFGPGWARCLYLAWLDDEAKEHPRSGQPREPRGRTIRFMAAWRCPKLETEGAEDRKYHARAPSTLGLGPHRRQGDPQAAPGTVGPPVAPTLQLQGHPGSRSGRGASAPPRHRCSRRSTTRPGSTAASLMPLTSGNRALWREGGHGSFEEGRTTASARCP